LTAAALARFLVYQLIHWDISFGLPIPNPWEFFLSVDIPTAVFLSVFAYLHSTEYRDSRKERLKRAAATAGALTEQLLQQRIDAINRS
jgi:hypothetical protein